MLTAIRNLNYIRSKDPRLYEAVSDVIQKAKAASEKISLGAGQDFSTIAFDHPLASGDLDAVQLLHVFNVANVANTIPHNLGRVPTGYLVAGTNVAFSVYSGNVSHWTDKTIELLASGSGGARLIVF